MEKLFRTHTKIKFAEDKDAKADSPSEIQLFRVGTFHHPEYGKFEITLQHLSEMKRNFDARVRGIDIAVDYKHASEDVAAGWIKDVYLSEDGKELWAKVDWTPKGSKVLADKEFRYISPEFDFEYQDNETLKKFGPTLLGAGLTNRPVIKRMEPTVELMESRGEKMSDQVQANEGEKKYGEGEGMSPEEMMKLIAELKSEIERLKGEKEMSDKKMGEFEKEKQMAEKKAQFAKLMAEGKACAAQEKSFVEGDMVKFAELAQVVKLSEKGSGAEGTETTTEETAATGDEEDQIMAKAEKILAAEPRTTMADAIRRALIENPKLAEKYQGTRG